MTKCMTVPYQDTDLILLVLAFGHRGTSCEVNIHDENSASQEQYIFWGVKLHEPLIQPYVSIIQIWQ